MMIPSRVAGFLIASLAVLSGGALGQQGTPPQAAKDAVQGEVQLIPRRLLLEPAWRRQLSISPDGTRLAYIAGVSSRPVLWVQPLHDAQAGKSFLLDDRLGVSSFQWAFDNKHILAVKKLDRRGNTRIVVVNVESGEVTDLSKANRMRLSLVKLSKSHPEELVATRTNRRHGTALVHFNFVTAERTDLFTRTASTEFGVDDDLRVRFSMKASADRSSFFVPDEEENAKQAAKALEDKDQDDTKKTGAEKKGAWNLAFHIPRAIDTTTVFLGLDHTAEAILAIDNRTREYAALVRIDLGNGTATVLFEDASADVTHAMIHPDTRVVQAVAVTRERRKWKALDKKIEKDLKFLQKGVDGDFNVFSRSADDQHWIVAYEMSNGLVNFHHYNRATSENRLLFADREELHGLPLPRKVVCTIKARDGLDLVSYLTLPAEADRSGSGRPTEPLPMVLSVHGGPWQRDGWGFDPLHVLLADRGYAVLSVNYRGSSGFGRSFMDAGDRQWGRKMQDDLLDGVEWAVKEGIADKDRIAIMGSTYGGYAALCGLTQTPETFACGVDLSGPANLLQYLGAGTSKEGSLADVVRRRVGDIRDAAEVQRIYGVSPVQQIDNLVRPLLVGQGARDPAVPRATMLNVVQALRSRGVPSTLVLFPNEAHGLARRENIGAFMATVEAFLSRHLGGRAEPIGNAFDRAGIMIPLGANEIPGAVDALKKPTQDTPSKAK